MFAILCVTLFFQWSQSAAPIFSSYRETGVVRSHYITEASGLAASRIHQGVLYTHNDRGHSSVIYAVAAESGKLLAKLNIGGVRNYDWEDIAIGPCSLRYAGHHCIYIAETGNHGGDGAKNIIYRVPEPEVIKDQTLHVTDHLHFRWSELNCECVMVDPTGNTYIVSKVHGGQGLITKLPSYGWGGTTVDIRASHRVSITSTHNGPNGCDISPDGKEMLLKVREAVYYWSVPDGDYMAAIRHPGTKLPYHPEPQGESVAWSASGNGYYTLSEGKNQPIFFYQRQ